MKCTFLKLIFRNFESLHNFHNDILFLHEKMKIEKLVANLYDKTEYIIHTRNLKQA